ncbi:MAG: hypothetical protein K6F82_00320 [Sphaerochaetaceae bacterium]|nr:hypothetical protein [Sphaerochaetaceae bacterium]
MEKKGFKERVRKFVVTLKRNPSRIPLVALVLCFGFYSFNLTCISNTTAKINSPGMGIYGFVTMLFSMLSLVAFMNSFPHRKPVNKVMLGLSLAMVALVIFADFQYKGLILHAVDPSNPNHITVTENTMYIVDAYAMLTKHIVFLIISVALTVLLPVYGKLLKKINTNVNVEGYGKMEAIELQND